MSRTCVVRSRCSNSECRYHLFEVVLCSKAGQFRVCPQCGRAMEQCDHPMTLEHVHALNAHPRQAAI